MTRLWFATALLPEGWAQGVRISAAEGRIESVESGVEAGSGDERHAIGVPGLGNLHSHAFQRGLAGLTERRGPTEDSFWSWRELMYHFVERIDPDELEALAAMAYLEMLESGFTHVGEFHYVHHDKEGVPFADPGELAGRIAAAARETGIGLTLLPTFYAHSGFGAAAPSARQRRFVCDLERYVRIVESSRGAIRDLPGAHLGVAPHSLRAVSVEELAAVVELGKGLPKHLHVAEQAREVEDCVIWFGLRPIEWLMQNAPVDEHWCLVHATHANTRELDQIAAARAVVAVCPLTESSLGDGIFPAPGFMEQHGRFGIGSDSNIRIDVAEELRTLEYAQRLDLQARNVLAAGPGKSTGRTLFDTALAAGAQALEAPAGLQKGASLDVLSLCADHVALAERRGDDLLDGWIFCGDHGVVDHVWRGGRQVVVNGHHVQRDAITTRYRRALRSLLA